LRHIFNIFAVLSCILFLAQIDAAAHPPGHPMIQNGVLRASVNESTAGFYVEDTRNSHIWETYGNAYAASNMQANGLTITWQDPNGLTCALTMDAVEPELIFELSGDQNTDFDHTWYPRPFYLDTASGRIAIAYYEGLLVPVRGHADTVNFWMDGHLGPWVGFVDMQDGYGCMTILDTFADAGFSPRTIPGGSQEDLLTYEVYWRPEKGKLGYTRRLVYWFSDLGTYVAQAKRFRAWADKKEISKTLDQKAEDNPEVDKLRGAIDIYHFWWPTVPVNLEEFANYLNGLDIDRAILNTAEVHRAGLVPPNFHMEHQIPNVIQSGYIVSSYDVYTDIYPSDGPHGLNYPSDTIKMELGDPQPGWMPESYVACSTRRLQALQQYMPLHLSTYPANAHFLDCEAKTAPFECYDPSHPMIRRDDFENRLQMFQYLSAGLELIVGSEGGQFWALDQIHYGEDVMTVTHGWANWVPDSMDGPIHYDLCPKYIRYELGHDVRAPLYQLAFHDCAVTTYRWVASNIRPPELMWKKDLMNLLYGTAPIWLLLQEGACLLASESGRLAQTYEMVCEVNKYTQFQQMVSHEYLTGNGDLQRTTWAGGLKITVNFSETESYEIDGQVLTPASYLLEGDSQEYPNLSLGKAQDAYAGWRMRVEAQKLVVNGDLEEIGVPLWMRNRGAVVEHVSENTHSGAGALRVDARYIQEGYAYLDVPLGTLKPGRNYRISVSIKTLDSGKGVLDYPRPAYVSMRDEIPGQGPTWNSISLEPEFEDRLGEWIEYTKTICLPETHYYGWFDIGRWNNEADGALFIVDDIKVQPLGVKDTDGDTYWDDDDMFPSNSDEWEDVDEDGLGDNTERVILKEDLHDDYDDLGDVDPQDDFDSDGISNLKEFQGGFKPTDADTDEDGILDGNEDKNHDGLIEATAGETDPSNPDSDGDGIYDGTEIGLTEPQDSAATDLSAGVFVPDADPETTTDPANSDTDGDSVIDGDEDIYRDGAYNPDEGDTDPNSVEADFNDDGDVDGSDLATYTEVSRGLLLQTFANNFGRTDCP
jgi:hypothetical protein